MSIFLIRSQRQKEIYKNGLVANPRLTGFSVNFVIGLIKNQKLSHKEANSILTERHSGGKGLLSRSVKKLCSISLRVSTGKATEMDISTKALHAFNYDVFEWIHVGIYVFERIPYTPNCLSVTIFKQEKCLIFKKTNIPKEQQRILLKESDLRIWIFPFHLDHTFLEM